MYLHLHGFGFSTNVAEMIGQACHNGFAAQPHGQTKEAVPTTEFGFGCHVGMVCHLQSGSWSYRVAPSRVRIFRVDQWGAWRSIIQRHPASSIQLFNMHSCTLLAFLCCGVLNQQGRDATPWVLTATKDKLPQGLIEEKREAAPSSRRTCDEFSRGICKSCSGKLRFGQLRSGKLEFPSNPCFFL